MRQYDIGKLIGGNTLLPVIQESPGFNRSYLAELRRVLSEIAKFTRNVIIPAYQNELVTDARESDFDALRKLTEALLLSTTQAVKNLIELESIKHTDRFMESARSAFGIDLKSVVEKEDLTKYLDQAAARNAGLIKGMTGDLIKNIQLHTMNALINGDTVATLRKTLKDDFGIADNRAKLIARDQTSKLNADLTKIRHQQAGVDSYVWRTSQDERVRKRHRPLDGKTYRYGEPTGAESGLEPGHPIQCRCIAQGVVTFGDETFSPPVKPSANGTVEEWTFYKNRLESTGAENALKQEAEEKIKRLTGKSKPVSLPPGIESPKKKPVVPAKPVSLPKGVAPPKKKPVVPAKTVEKSIQEIKKLPVEKPANVPALVVEKSERKAQKQFAKLNKNLTDKEESYLDYYNGDGFLRVNTALREGKLGDVRDMYDNLTSAIDKSELTDDVRLYRGVKNKDLFNAFTSDSTGSSIKLSGFQSTTTNKDFAEKWAGKLGQFGTGDNVIFEIRAKKGQKALYSNLASDINRHEQHVILKHDQSYRVAEVLDEGSTKTVILEIEE